MTAGPQCEDGYTKLANELLEAMCRFRIPGESMQIFLTILRKTYGFGKKMDMISLNQFVEATGVGKPNVVRSLRQLLTLNVIRVEKTEVAVFYGVNKHHETWIREKREKVRPLSKTITEIVVENDNYVVKNDNAIIESDNESLSEVTTVVIESDNESLSKVIPTKEIKETFTKEISSSLPKEGEEEIVAVFSDEVMWITEELARLILLNNPKNRELQQPKYQATVLRWAGDIDKMIRIDRREPREVAVVVRWCQKCSFWKSNILSGSKLREQYDQLIVKMRAESREPPRGGSSRLQRNIAAAEEAGRLLGVWDG